MPSQCGLMVYSFTSSTIFIERPHFFIKHKPKTVTVKLQQHSQRSLHYKYTIFPKVWVR